MKKQKIVVILLILVVMLSVGVTLAIAAPRADIVSAPSAEIMEAPRASMPADPIFQTFYFPLPEGDLSSGLAGALSDIDDGCASENGPLESVGSISIGYDGTHIYYDQAEDGFEVDLEAPVQTTTEIWGDMDPLNGTPPGFATDELDAGDIIILAESMTLPIGTTTYDGSAGDKVGASKPVAVTRAAWLNDPGTVLAGAVEIYDTTQFGTNFNIPMGEDSFGGTAHYFEYTAISVLAAQNGTQIDVDTTGNGLVDVTTTINEGESWFSGAGILYNASVTADGPVQVHAITGDIDDCWESRWITIPPDNQRSSSYISPVGSPVADDTYMYVYNPYGGAMTLNLTTDAGSIAPVVIASGGITLVTLPINSGILVEAEVGGAPVDFLPIILADADGNAAVHDWGFAMFPVSGLSTTILVGWGPGANQDPITDNYNPLWVAAAADTILYVSYNGGGANTAPNGQQYDIAITVSALESVRIYDPDNDQTGMRVFTADGTRISGAYGQDADTAPSGNPALDLGTGVLPLPVVDTRKSGSIYNDLDMDGLLDPGDTISYTIFIEYLGPIDINQFVVSDTVPVSTTYVLTSLEINGDTNALMDDGVGTPFPLDEGGSPINLGVLPSNNIFAISFMVTVDDPAPGMFPPDLIEIINEANIQTLISDDYPMVPLPLDVLDYGDLPDSYDTLLASDGPRHSDSGLYLGDTADFDTNGDGNPTTDATGDDALDGSDDEDGITFPNTSWDDGDGTVNVNVSGGLGCLNMWVDFTDGASVGSDGDFLDSLAGDSEWAIQNLPVDSTASPMLVNFDLPTGALTTNGTMNLRFRLTPRDAAGGCTGVDTYGDGTVSHDGVAYGGEVEDHQVAAGALAISLQDFAATSQSTSLIALAVGAIMLVGTAVVVLRFRRERG